MKKIIAAIAFIACLSLSATAQNDKPKSQPPTKAAVEKMLPGTWVVQNKGLLPKPADGQKEYMKDSLVFGELFMFSNGHNPNVPATLYSYDEETGLITVLESESNKGVAYEVATLSDKKLVVWVPNATKTDFIELVYTKVSE